MAIISRRVVTLFAILVILCCANVFADTYHSTNFTGQLGSSPNIKSPFNSVLSPSGAVTGSFVYDDQLVPGGGTGFTNVFYFMFPDIGQIPNATAFSINLGGGLVFDLGGEAPGTFSGIQYNNGNFNGFSYFSDFMFQGNPYEFYISGGTFFIVPIVNGFPGFQNLVSGTLNIGNNNLSGTSVYVPGTPTPAVPEPSSLVLLGSGVATAVASLRRKLKK